MKTLLKIALAGALAAVVVKLVRRSSADNRIPTVNPAVGGGPVENWAPDAGEPLRGENLTTEPVTH